MRFRLQAFLLLALSAFAAPAPAADTTLDKPIVVLQIQSVDEILNRAGYIAQLAGKEEESKQLIGLVRSMVRDKGLEGLDIKKPIVAYAYAGAGTTPLFAVMVPVADEESVLSVLKNRLFIEPKKEKDGLYVVNSPLAPMELYIRFANGYAYLSSVDKKNLDPASLAKPEKIVSSESTLFSLTVNVSNIPKMLRDLALGQFEMKLAEDKNKKDPNAPPELQALKPQILDRVAALAKQMLNETKTFRIKWDVDSKTDELSASFELEGIADSELAKMVEGFKTKRTAAGAVIDAASPVAFHANVTVPELVKKIYVTLLDQKSKEMLEKAPAEIRDDFEKLYKTIEPSLKSGIVDWAFSIKPSGEKINVAVGLQVVGGKAIELALKSAWEKAPEEVKGMIQFDADTVGNVKLHEFKVGPVLDENAKRMFGESNIWLAFRDDIFFLAMGPNAKETIKAGIVKLPVEASPMKLDFSFTTLIPTLESASERATWTKFSKEILGKKPGSDKIVVSFEGGPSAKLKFAMKGSLLEFLLKVDQAKKGD